MACEGNGGLGVSRSFSSLISILMSFASDAVLAPPLLWLHNFVPIILSVDVVVVVVIAAVVVSALQLVICGDNFACDESVLLLSLFEEVVLLLVITDDSWLIFVSILSLFSSEALLDDDAWLFVVDFFDFVLLLGGVPPSTSTSISLSSAENGNTLQGHTIEGFYKGSHNKHTSNIVGEWLCGMEKKKENRRNYVSYPKSINRVIQCCKWWYVYLISKIMFWNISFTFCTMGKVIWIHTNFCFVFFNSSDHFPHRFLYFSKLHAKSFQKHLKTDTYHLLVRRRSSADAVRRTSQEQIAVKCVWFVPSPASGLPFGVSRDV